MHVYQGSPLAAGWRASEEATSHHLEAVKSDARKEAGIGALLDDDHAETRWVEAIMRAAQAVKR